LSASVLSVREGKSVPNGRWVNEGSDVGPGCGFLQFSSEDKGREEEEDKKSEEWENRVKRREWMDPGDFSKLMAWRAFGKDLVLLTELELSEDERGEE